MNQAHSAVGQSAWIDLLRLLKQDSVSEIRGKPRVKTIRGRSYWYDQYRVGDQTVDRYLGEDTQEMQTRIAQHREIALQADDRGKERARLMRILRAEGYLTPDLGTGQIVQALARAGVFRLGGTLVGTQAFRTYEGVLGVQIGFDQSAMTQDIDIASFERLSLVLDDEVEEDLVSVFDALKFAPVPSLQKGEVWRWLQTQRQTLVEFLTPSFSDEEGLRPLKALGVSAQSLHYLNYLIADPMTVPFLYRGGVLIQVPRPERYAIHKLIVADRRRDGELSQKSEKDRQQAAFLINVLAQERPLDLAEAYTDAMGRGAAWKRRIGASLERLPEAAAQLSQCSQG
jgi:hypothetical protein